MDTQQSEFNRGMDFAVATLGADVAVTLSEDYINSIVKEIESFEERMLALASQQGDAQLAGFVAEEWHASLFNLAAIVADSKHRAWARRERGYASVDIDTNFGKQYSSKYYQTAAQTASQQAQQHRVTGEAKYANQERLVPSDQHEEIKQILNRRAEKDIDNRPDVAKINQETEKHVTATVSNGKISSKDLSKDKATKIAKELKKDEFSAKNHDVSLATLIRNKDVLRKSVKAGLSAALISMIVETAPDIYKAIDYLIKTGDIDLDSLKEPGKQAVTSSGESFLRGFLAAAITIGNEKGVFGEWATKLNPTMIGAMVAVIIGTIKDSIQVATGKIDTRTMGDNFIRSVVVSSGYYGGTLIAKAVKEALKESLGIAIPGLGFLIGTLVGCAMAATYELSRKKFISFCVDTGFTCFGLVEQNYVLPQKVIDELGIDTIPIERATIDYIEIPQSVVETVEVNRKLETIEFTTLRRCVIGVNRIGYAI